MPRRIATILAAVLFFGCGPQPSLPRPVPGTGGTPVEVQRFAAQPRFTSLYREGDPYAVLSLAAATDLGPGPHAALAAVVRSRLREREADVRSDGLAVRITLPTRSDPAATLAVLAGSLGAELTADELAAARDAWDRQAPLAHPALDDWTRCTGAAGRRLDAAPPDDPTLRGWLGQLTTDRLGLAFVGPAALGDAVAAALPSTTGWPQGEPAPTPAPADAHHAYIGEAPRLRLGLYHPDAVRAVAAAQGLAGASPLAQHLALLAPPWRLTEAGASAHARGGCLHVELAPVDGITPEDGAEAVAMAQRDLRVALKGRPRGFAATREVLAGGDVHETARRAAWWALTEPSDAKPATVSVLELGRVEGAPDAVDDAHREADAAYRAALQPVRDGAKPELRVAVEAGQGGFWMLAAQPCALDDEGEWDAGHAALAVAALVDEPGDVTVEPWVTPQGVGLLAHALPRHARERPAALARRVARALGQRLTALPSRSGITLARREVLALLGDERAQLLAAASERVAPGHPSWLVPWGLRDRVGDAEAAAVMSRWRRVLTAGPWRVATLANTDEPQAKAAMAALRPWLPVTPERCSAQPQTGATGGAAPLAVRSTAPGATVLRVYPVDDPDMARLVAAAAEPRLGDLDFEAGVRVIDGPRPVLVLWGQAASADREAVAKGLDQLADSWASLEAATLEAARQRLRARLEAERRAPRQRLAQLWRGARPAVPQADVSVVRAWLERTLKRGTKVADR